MLALMDHIIYNSSWFPSFIIHFYFLLLFSDGPVSKTQIYLFLFTTFGYNENNVDYRGCCNVYEITCSFEAPRNPHQCALPWGTLIFHTRLIKRKWLLHTQLQRFYSVSDMAHIRYFYTYFITSIWRARKP